MIGLISVDSRVMPKGKRSLNLTFKESEEQKKHASLRLMCNDGVTVMPFNSCQTANSGGDRGDRGNRGGGMAVT